jgi:molybdopterin synthase sulfur carrier subunit
VALKLVFLGRLEDLAGGAEREIETVASVDAVLALLDSELATALKAEKVKLAVNGMLFHDRTAPVLKDGDELAFLPPVSGG